jgi:hypothetical protein
MAQNFSAALDEMFKLDGIGALELSLNQKYDFSLLPQSDTRYNVKTDFVAEQERRSRHQEIPARCARGSTKGNRTETQGSRDKAPPTKPDVGESEVADARYILRDRRERR